MNISLSEFQVEEFNDLHEEFQETAQQLQSAPDEIMFIDELVLGVHITYDDVMKLNNEGKMNFKSMIYFINYIQKRSKQVHQFYLAYQRQSLDLVEQLNEMLRKFQQKGDVVNYILIFFWVDRWVAGVYNLKTTILEIVDLQKNKTKDDLKKMYEQLLKKTGLPKVSFKTINYIQQEDKTTDGGMFIINYLYQTLVKGTAFVKLNDKTKLKQQLIWLFYRGEKSQHVDYPSLPPLSQFNESEVKQYQLVNQEPFLPGSWTGIEIQISDFELLQKSGKSKLHMMAFWLSYLYYFDLQSKNPLLPFFVVANGEEICEEFEVIFKPRRRQGADNQRLIILMYIQNTRWVFAVYHMIQKSLDIIDLQHKNITKDALKNSFDKVFSALVTYGNPNPNFITQTNTDSTDGTEYVVNYLWQYMNGTQLDKVKFGFSEKRQLRTKLVWALIKMQNSPMQSQKSIQIPSKKKITIPLGVSSPQQSQQQQEAQNTPQTVTSRFNRGKEVTQQQPEVQNTPQGGGTSRFNRTKSEVTSQKSNKNIDEQTPQQKKTFVSSFKNRLAASQQSPANSPSKSQISDPKSEIPEKEVPSKKSSLFSRKQLQSDQSPKSQTSETSIQLAKPAGRTFTAKKTAFPSAAKGNGTNKNASVMSKQEPIIETQRSEEYDEDEFSDLFNKKKKSIDNSQIQQNDGMDRLERIQEELTEYYHEIINDDEDKQIELQKLQEIFRLNLQIKKHLEKKKLITLDEVLDTVKNKNNTSQQSVLYNSSLQNYSTVLHDDQGVLRMINEMVQNENEEDSIETTLQKRRNYVLAEISSMDVSGPSVSYELPPMKNESQQSVNQSISLPSIRRNTAELFQRTNLAASRYGIKLEIPTLQQFYQNGKMNNQIFNFLLKFIEEKANHQRKNNVFNYYSSRIKLFPVQFYQVLCFNLIHSTYRINYFEANQFTFEHTGQDETIFDVFDWLIVPVVEYPTEYSLVFVNLKRKTCYCYLLSSLAMRIKDPLYINPEKNPYMKNVITFLQYEFEVKMKKPKEELGRFSMQFGLVNDNNQFSYSINYDYSGLYGIYIIIHLVKHGHNSEIKIDDYQIQVLRKTFHDLIVRIGYNEDDNLFHLLENNQFPF